MREYARIEKKDLFLLPNSSRIWDKKFLVTNKSNKCTYTVNKLSLNDWGKIKIFMKKDLSNIPFSVKLSLPAFKSLEGSISVPHLNIWGSIKDKDLIEANLENWTSENFNELY